MIEPETKVVRNERAAFRTLEDGTAVVLHLDTTQYHGVNEVGAAIWELTESSPTFESLLGQLRGKLDDPPTDLEGDVESFLYALKERDLIDLVSGDAG